MTKLPYRPVLKLPKTKGEKLFDFFGVILFIASIVYLVVQWGDIPDKIPAHFNSAGEVDRWGSKGELFILPSIGFFLHVLLSLLEKAPHMHNYPKRLNEQNVEQFYLQSRKLLNAVKNICLLMFAYLTVQIARVAKSEIESLGIWFLPVLLIVMFGAIGIGIYKQSKIK